MSSTNSGHADPDGLPVRVVSFDGSSEEWDGFVSSFSDSTFCHLGGWGEIMSGVLGHRLYYRVAEDSRGKVCGVLPMVRVASRLFGDYLVSMPFLSYGGPLGTPAAREALVLEAVREARELGVDLLELRSRDPLPGSLNTSLRKLTVLKELPETPEILWEKGIKAKVRSQIRRPQKEGMEPRFGNDQSESFYRVFSRTMRDLGTPVLPEEFFQALVEVLPEQVLFCTIERGGEAVAAGCGFLWNREFEITWAGSLREHSRAAPNMLLYWSLMEEATRRGARTFNFGRCSPDSGTHRFKRQWGGEDVPLPWGQWSGGTVDATPAPTGMKYELATAVWRKTPLSITNWLGPFLSRNLP